ncbi:MFS transporter [Streptomyces nanshensis]|uniref:MFS transporter n=1 Tax=Streptomyces nanshensis TaxID=518642 RepID=UPI0009A019FD|nr:MFS transporter [Streptomyces nanshensis]
MTDKAPSLPAAGAPRGPGGSSGTHGPEDSHTPARLWVVVLAACAGQFLVVLDVSVVNVALPSMRTALGMDAAGLQWVLNGYTLTFAGLMLLGGRAADIFGRKRTFLTGLALFTAASLFGGLAQEPWQLLAARALQGTGAAVLAPATLTILTTATPPGRARTRAIATWSAVGAGGGAAGGLVGGVLTDALSWRWVLLINVPVGALVLLAAAVWVTERRDATAGRRLDLPGALLVTLGLSTLAWAIVRTEAAGWAAPSVLWPLAAGLAMLGAFVAVEARARAPLVPLRLLRNRAVSASNGAMFIFGGALFCMWYFVSLYMQNVLHYTPLQAGLGFIPQSLSIVIGSKGAPWLMARLGARTVALCGVAVAAAGCLWQSGMHAGGGFLETVTGPGVLMALGSGMAGTPLASVAMSGVPHSEAGLVSGLFNTARTMGGSLGLAVLSTVAAARIGDGDSPETLAAGYGLAFRSAALVLVVCAALILFVLPRPAREVPPAPALHEDG